MKAQKVHFVGIGGVGMSALAQLMYDQGAKVTGSDREVSPLTALLEQKGIKVVIGQKKENVPEDATIVVYSDSVPADNPERAHAEELGIEQCSYFAMLGRVLAGTKTVAVAGTHGKSTTTSMLTKILKDAGASPTAVIGSIVKDFASNYVHGDSELFVVEACEYKDHLLELSPSVLVITNLEWDHTDYFASLEALQATFAMAIAKVPADGAIVTDPHHPHIASVLKTAACRIIDYTHEGLYGLQMPGAFNQMNARAAAAAARIVAPELVQEQLALSLSTFQGTWRRFEYKGQTKNGARVYDDYAHHPTAIRETLTALREVAPKGRIFVAFHPHLYSRTRDLLDDFAGAFSNADKVFVAPIYAARETDDGSVSNKTLADRINAQGGHATALDSFEAIEEALSTAGPSDTIMTMGAGDIYKVADQLVQIPA
ncbi:hypothetical protein COU19_00600 [Candidatus Kaiserbacteria bacterium CG10_big_fil_rev_8_21_14_0_10_56_12]|uniref:UDP-N-acetylmuramate--L-alanine ligase n=1 Tax=Candidatus Kaiserbacteria bacterium CG10_big_fil_rev_8_21_14_0_10_56_12 TaxID=1974611 RepID=A0A2H0UAN5_9BACT|nr:MAG: hypothetical protein COU19_00600 [Candidatus Kaiserbacteria bacterium CG10_big_fil_rev_8_21_14_0_10_56_12]